MQIVRIVQSALLAIAVVIVGVAVAAPAHASAGADGASARSAARSKGFAPAFEKKVLQLTNRKRRKHHLRPLTISSCTERTWSRWARKLAARNASHQSMKSVGRACGTRYVGENIAMGRPLSAARVVSMWMHSRGHRANILNKHYRHLGVGAARSKRGLTYVVQNFRR